MKKPHWFTKLEKRWDVTAVQVVMILMVFACTGFTVMYLKDPVLSLVADEEERTWLFTLVYYIFILPVYNVILLAYGTVFGQFRFFWNFEKRMLRRMIGK